jgi:hypothetical protein
MKLSIMHKKALYRDLRSELGYYDARRIIRSIEEDPKISGLNELEMALTEKGFDTRQINLTVETAKKSWAPFEEAED